MEQVLTGVQRAVEQLPAVEIAASREHLRAASLILHTTLPQETSGTMADITTALRGAEQSGDNAQAAVSLAADALTRYVSETSGRVTTAPANAEPAVSHSNAAEHPAVAAVRAEADTAQDQLLPMIGKGNVARYMETLAELSDGALCELLRRNVPGADEVLIKRYSRWLWVAARSEFAKRPLRALDAEDLWMAGVTEFLASCRRYDPTREVHLTTYAGKNARNAMKAEARDTSHNVRVAQEVQTNIIHRITQENTRRMNAGRASMSDEDIATMFNLPLRAKSPQDRAVTVFDVRRAMLLTMYLGSIDTGFAARELGPDTPYIMNEPKGLRPLTGEPPLDAGEEAAKGELTQLLDEVLATVSSTEEKWVRLRFGLDGEEHTLRDAARLMDLTVDAAGRLERKVMNKLKHPSRRLRLE